MNAALIALGANIPPRSGDIKDTFETAIMLLDRCAEIRDIRRSRWYRTPAYPAGSGPDFLNGAIAVRTSLAPAELLARLHGVEAELGRQRDRRWAPRTCDIDLIAMGDRVLPDAATAREWMALDLGRAQTLVPPRLVLPHPRLQERAFVLVPLADVAPGWRHPLTGRSVAEMLAALPPGDLEAIRPVEDLSD